MPQGVPGVSMMRLKLDTLAFRRANCEHTPGKKSSPEDDVVQFWVCVLQQVVRQATEDATACGLSSPDFQVEIHDRVWIDD